MSLDLFNLADTSYKTQIFYSSGNWVKPRGCSAVTIITIGAGGGGGGGIGKTGGVNGSGGGGGGSGAMTRITIPSIFLTNTLIVNVGKGGSGGSGSSSSPATGGTNGSASYVALNLNNQSVNWTTIIAQSNGGLGGGGGTAGGTGAGGAGGTITTTANFLIGNFGIFTSIAGQTATNGGTSSTPTALTWGNTGLPISAGSGGGGSGAGGNNSDNSGGNIVVSGFAPQLAQANSVQDGPNGYTMLNPFLAVGGFGGGSRTAQLNPGPYIGRNGGNGGIGCGGGGGGTGRNDLGGYGGNGGNGGDGIVIIISH